MMNFELWSTALIAIVTGIAALTYRLGRNEFTYDPGKEAILHLFALPANIALIFTALKHGHATLTALGIIIIAALFTYYVLISRCGD
jgi:hypothetical protein